MRVGIVGQGRMGSAMAQRLIETGNEVTVWNRSVDKTAPAVAAGATAASSPAALAQSVEAMIVIMRDAAALDSVFHGADGLLAAPLQGRVIIEMSTVRPQVEQALAEAVGKAGGAFLECPVGGTVGPARSGKLLGLAGGDEAAFIRAKPLLDQLCRRVEHVGPAGAGAAMKLAINLPLAIYWQALGEANALVRHLGRDPAWLIDLFADSSGGANALKVRGPAVAQALAGGDGGPASFDLDGVRKDLRTMLEEAYARGFDLPLAASALGAYDSAAAAGKGARDAAWMPAFWAERADAPQPKHRVGLADAAIIIDAALRLGRELALAPLTVAVLDAGGHLVAFKREDESGLLRFDIAFGKAWGALGMGFGSREFLARSQTNPSFVGAIAAASGGRVIPVPGGVLIRNAAQEVVGAVGISGDTSDKDEACCLAGIAAAGFTGQIGA